MSEQMHTLQLTTAELWDLIIVLNLAYDTIDGALRPRLTHLFGELEILERLRTIDNLRAKCVRITDANGWT
jgi:hypothetical protein